MEERDTNKKGNTFIGTYDYVFLSIYPYKNADRLLNFVTHFRKQQQNKQNDPVTLINLLFIITQCRTLVFILFLFVR